MVTYLLVWNPNRWHWWDDLEDSFTRRGGKWLGRWSTGRSKSLRKGDRVFLLRLGRQPRGIVGAGFVTSPEPYLDRHWEKDRAARGEKALYVKAAFETLLNPARVPILTIDTLRRTGLSSVHWFPQGSGISLAPEAARHLETLWTRFLGSQRLPLVVVEPQAVEGLRTEVVAYARGRSRALRDAALAESRAQCQCCRVDFSRILGGRGVRALQVHHRRQIAATDRPRVTRLSDLAVVCANCHSLIHMNPQKALPVERLASLLEKDRRGLTSR